MDKLKEYAAQMGIIIEESRLPLFKSFMEEVTEVNKVMNLTAITQPHDFLVKHYLDSLSLLSLSYFEKGVKLIDVGCGAGFPGIPLFFARPDIKLTLLDSLNKRVNFLKNTMDKLKIDNVVCMHARAEEAARKKELREGFDIAVSRAVADLPVLCELCLPFVKLGGVMLALKGPAADIEVQRAENSIKTLGAALENIVEVKIPQSEATHKIVIIKKTMTTNPKYPRQFAKISKNPL